MFTRELIQILVLAALAGAAGMTAVAAFSYVKARKVAEARGQPRPSFFWLYVQYLFGALLVAIGLALYVALEFWIDDLAESHELLLVTTVVVTWGGGLVYLVFFYKGPWDNPGASALAEALGLSHDPRFRRRWLTLSQEDDVIRGWRGRRVGLTLREANTILEVPAYLSISLEVVDASAPGGISLFTRQEIERDAETSFGSLLIHKIDRVKLDKRGRLEVRLALDERDVEWGGGVHTLYSDTVPDSPRRVAAFAARIWARLTELAERHSVGGLEA